MDEQKYRELVDLLPQAVFEIDQNLKFTFANHHALKISGYTQEDIEKGLDALDLFIPEDRDRARGNIARILRGERLQGNEYTAMRKDGSTFPVIVYSSPIIRGNKPVGLRGIAYDITERKGTEEALWESELKHKTLVHNIPGMVYRGYPDWSAEIISGCRAISGFSKDEISSKEENWLSIIHPDDREKIFREGLEFIKRPKSMVHVYRIITKDGATRWVEDRKTSLFTKEGDFLGIEGVVFDVTDRIIAERKLKASKEAIARAHIKLEEKVKKRTADLSKSNQQLQQEIENRSKAEEELKSKTRNLEEINIALKVLLDKRYEEKAKLEETVLSNVKELIEPYLEKLKRTVLDDRQISYVSVLESNLNNIISPFSSSLSSKFLKLSASEIRIADLVKQGRSTKEIAELMSLSIHTVSTHRRNIRKKLGLLEEKSNLRSHLLSTQQ